MRPQHLVIYQNRPKSRAYDTLLDFKVLANAQEGLGISLSKYHRDGPKAKTIWVCGEQAIRGSGGGQARTLGRKAAFVELRKILDTAA